MAGWKEWEHDLMKVALTEAARGNGKTHPNPAVGAVIARGRRIVGRGYHRRPGLPHAEIEAMRAAGSRVRGADLYVTLEPCCHWGKTAPCTGAIIEGGIRRVFVAIRDPNPVVRGKGIRELREGGLEVEVGLGAGTARKINETYIKFMREGKPFVTLKLAQTLDGRIATRNGESRWITGAASRGLARRMRAGAQAIIVGASTVVNDNPGLLPSPRRSNYLRCVLDSTLRMPPASDLVRTASKYPTLVYHCRGSMRRVRNLEAVGVTTVRLREDARGGVDVRRVLDDLASRGVMHVFVEGGGVVASSFLRSGLVDKLILFVAPRIMGDLHGLGAFSQVDVGSIKKCHGFKIDEVSRVDRDLMIVLYPER